MRILRLLALELRCLMQNRLSLFLLLLSILSPLIGLFLVKPSSARTMQSMYLANPAICGGAGSGILFGLLTIHVLDRPVRNRAAALMDTAVSPLFMNLIRLLSLLTAAALTLTASVIIWLPVSRMLIGQVFRTGDYLLAYLLLTGASLPLSILAAAAFWQLTGRTDLALTLFLAFCVLSLTVWNGQWQLCWLNPCVWALSDDFSNFRIFRSAAYMRLTWLAALSGFWSLSWFCTRRYEKSLLGSLTVSCRRCPAATAAWLLLPLSVLLYQNQPFIDHSNPDTGIMAFSGLPVSEGITCRSRTVRISPDTAAGRVSGTAVYSFENSSGRPETIAFGITPGYSVSSINANGKNIPFSISDYQEYNEALLEVILPARKEIELSIEYGGFPRESSLMSAHQGSTEISETYLCLSNAELAPRLMNVKPEGETLPVTVEITLPEHMQVIPFSSARAEIISDNKDGTLTWRYTDTGTGGILYAGDYVCREIKAEDLTVEFCFGRRHEAVMEEASAVSAIETVMNYCTDHYGPLSFRAGNTLKLIQSRVTGGGYATDGASLLDETDFTAASLSNRKKGSRPAEVMIHELVHQWWGLSCMFEPSDGTGAWSAEGLTVYTTYRIVKELYGESYAEQFYTDMWRQETADFMQNFYIRHPEYLELLPEEKKLMITNRLSQVRQYCEMPLKILKAEQLVGGEDAMDQILQTLFRRQPNPDYPYLTYQDFLTACGLREEELNFEKDMEI